MIKKNKLVYVIVLLAVVNLILYWTFTQEQEQHEAFDIKVSTGLNVTIVIPYFEAFDNDLLNTVKHLQKNYPLLSILALSEKIPYPYPKINNERIKFIYKKVDPSIPKHETDPLSYIKTNHILIIPDGARVEKNAIEKLLGTLKQHANNIVAAPIDGLRCSSIDFDIKRWTITYLNQEIRQNCDFVEGAALLFHKKILLKFNEPFGNPFYESFFIQAKLNNLKTHIENRPALFKRGKYLFTSSHLKWKHDVNLEKQQKTLYEQFGIKRLLTSSGQEKWFGCSKTSSRCFPSVLDVPYFLLQGRWTPPCCLQALRETARHVFSTCENSGIVYWLEGGSLLGAARHHDIIPWDYDVDIGIYLKDINKVSFLQKVWNGDKYTDYEGFVWERASDGDFIRVQYSKTNHLHVDIFPFYEKNGVMTKNTWFKTHRQDMEFPARFLKPLKRLQFVGVDAMVPNNYRDFLEMKFGRGVIEKPEYPFPEKLIEVKFTK